MSPGFWNWDWMGRNADVIGDRLLQHLILTGLAVGIGLVIALPLAVAAYRHPRIYPPVAWFTGLLYTIPSLAALAMLYPLLGLSTTNAVTVLSSYTLLILVRNTVTGLRGVPADVKEAARGMGYTDRQLLWKVEMPLALPAIVAGIRIATVTTIGLVTVTALIGQGGLGALMVAGFRRLFPRIAILLGVTLSVALAVAADGGLLWIQRLLSPWARRTRERAT
ncbi:MAG TPA: ABC transporter permease [Actinomycetota bacterium]